MQQQGQNVRARRVQLLRLDAILFGSRLAEHHRIDGFEMRRVCGQRQVNPVVVKLAVG